MKMAKKVYDRLLKMESRMLLFGSGAFVRIVDVGCPFGFWEFGKIHVAHDA
mgnify:CR=1 FL=1